MKCAFLLIGRRRPQWWRASALRALQARSITTAKTLAVASLVSWKVASCEPEVPSRLFTKGAVDQVNDWRVGSNSVKTLAPTLTSSASPLIDSLRRTFRELLAIASDLFRAAQLAFIFTPATLCAIPLALVCKWLLCCKAVPCAVVRAPLAFVRHQQLIYSHCCTVLPPRAGQMARSALCAGRSMSAALKKPQAHAASEHHLASP